MKDGNHILRIKYSKHGLMRYIGHLDMMRHFRKVIRRSGIDAAYSEGFSPHQIMSFAQPLSVGVESNGEYFDLEVKSLTSSDDIKRRMNEAAAEGIEVLDVRLLPYKAPKAMASIGSASYTVMFREGYEPDWDVYSAVKEFNERTSVKIMKKSKRSVREIELKELVRSISAEHLTLSMTLCASSGDNVKPELVINALKDIACGSGGEDESDGDAISKLELLITREDLYDSDMKPLSEAGTRF